MTELVNLKPFIGALERGETVLTPGLRLARALTDAWVRRQMEQTRKSIAAPQIYPVDGWLESQWSQRIERGDLPPARLLSRLEERSLWQQLIEEDSAGQQGFQLLQPSAAAEGALQSRQALLLYAEDPTAALARAGFQFDLDCAAFQRWLNAFEAALADHGWVTRPDAYRQLLTVPAPAQRALTLAYCDHLPSLTTRTLGHLGVLTPIGHVDAASVVPVPSTAYADRSSELAAAAAWAADRYREKAGTTAIVVMDLRRDRPELEYFLREQFDCLEARYNSLPVNFSTGIPLADTPMYRDALLALRVGNLALPRADYLSVLRSPFLLPDGFGETPEALALSRALTDLGSDLIDGSDFAHLVHKYTPGSALAATVTQLRSGDWGQRSGMSTGSAGAKRTLDEWAESIRARLALWSWPARQGLDSLEFQQIQRFEDSLDQLVALGEVLGEVSFERAVTLWRSVLADRIFQPKTEASAVQVFGPLEAIGLSIDEVWVCGAQSGALPRPPQRLPFLPGGLQRELMIPASDAEQLQQEAAQRVASWQATHGRLRGSYHRQADGIEQLPSPLLDVQKVDDESVMTYDRWRAAGDLEWIDDALVPQQPDAPRFGGGASVLKNQASCPFRAFVLHRIGPKPVSDPVFGLSPAERGSLVHDALYRIWGQLDSQAGLRATAPDDLQRLVEECVADALRDFEQQAAAHDIMLRKRAGSACLTLEAQRVTKLCLEWLELESARTESFKVSERESDHQLTVGPLALTLRPDRVDELEDGRLVVIDYKTGSVSRSHWLGERPSDPQLPIYSLLDERVQGIAFGQLKRDNKGSVRFEFIGESLGLNPGAKKPEPLDAQVRKLGVEVESWGNLREVWRQRLEALATEFTEGAGGIEPLPGACRYCELSSVCRIGINSPDMARPDDTEMAE